MDFGSVIGYQYLLPTKRQKEYTISILIGLVVNFILNYILIKLCTSVGASIATVISELIVLIVQMYLIRNDISIKEIISLSCKYLISGTIMFAICILIRIILGLNLVSMIIQIIAGVISYVVILMLMKDEYLYMFIDRIKLMIRRK